MKTVYHSPPQYDGVLCLVSGQLAAVLIKHKNIINFSRAQSLGWYGHIERMQETRMVKAIYS
jgi:hypothetical protein